MLEIKNKFQEKKDTLKKYAGKALIVTAAATTLFPATPIEARNIQNFSNFVVPTSNSATGDIRVINNGITKVATGRRGVVNLSGSGGPTFIATMRNSAGASRGSTSVGRGQRVTFATPSAESGFIYWLYMRTTNTGSASNRTVTGSWSPDEF